MTILTPCINNTGDYLKLLYDLFTDLVKSPHEGQPPRALVFYEHEIVSKSYELPLYVLSLPDIIDSTYGDDGRDEDELSISILIKVPKNKENPSVLASTLAGFATAKLKEQSFADYLDPDADATEHPDDIQASPLRWNNNELGYEVTFTQRIRYGLEENTYGLWVGAELTETNGTVVNHEFESDNPESG